MEPIEMLFKETEDKIAAYKERIEELSTDRGTLMHCWLSAAAKLEELGYVPKLSPNKDKVEGWRCIE